MSWASEELANVDLGDKRRNRRLVTIVEDLSRHPSASVPQASRDPAALQGVYDFWSNPRIRAADILAGHQRSVIERSRAQKTVLAIQDTSEVDYSAHRKSTRGIGSLSNPEARGLKLAHRPRHQRYRSPLGHSAPTNVEPIAESRHP